MILIADSGSTKTDWCIVFNGTLIKRIGTKGINPFFQSEEEIQQELTASLLPQLPEGTINSVYFYGAGCTPEKAPVLRRAIADSLPVIGNIKANSDMLAAARGLCGHEAGIAYMIDCSISNWLIHARSCDTANANSAINLDGCMDCFRFCLFFFL